MVMDKLHIDKMLLHVKLRLNKLLHGGIRRTLLKFQAGGGTVALPKD